MNVQNQVLIQVENYKWASKSWKIFRGRWPKFFPCFHLLPQMMEVTHSWAPDWDMSTQAKKQFLP